MRLKPRNLFVFPAATARGEGQTLHMRVEGMVCDI
jgi:hypothetical protein